MRRLAAAVPDILAGLIRPVRLEHLAGRAEIGLADPADTGRLYGYLTPVLYGLPHSAPDTIQITPRFDGPHAEGHVEVRLRVVLAAWIPPGLRFGWQAFGPPG